MLYPHHIPTTSFQRVLLAAGSAVAALKDPYRGDMVAVCGETTAFKSLLYMKNKMENDATGKRILREKPRLHSTSINMQHLRGLPDHSLGKMYVEMLDKYDISPDTRNPVKFIDDPDLAYVLQRYREIHDFNHLLLGQPTNLRGEVAVKWFEAIQTRLPMCWLATVGGFERLSKKRKISLIKNDIPWITKAAKSSNFFMNIYFEEEFNSSVNDIQEKLKLPVT